MPAPVPTGTTTTASNVATGVFSKIPTKARVHFDLHSDRDKFPNTAGAYTAAANPTGFLQGSESHASLLNERGGVKLRLTSGSCTAPTLNFNGENFSTTAPGDWVVDQGSGAYRDITGTGTFTVANGEVNPGADNDLAMTLNGHLRVAGSGAPGPGGQDLLGRARHRLPDPPGLGAVPDHQHRPGDAFGVTLTSSAGATAGVTPMGPPPYGKYPVGLFDLPAGDSRLVTVPVPVRAPGALRADHLELPVQLDADRGHARRARREPHVLADRVCQGSHSPAAAVGGHCAICEHLSLEPRHPPTRIDRAGGAVARPARGVGRRSVVRAAGGPSTGGGRSFPSPCPSTRSSASRVTTTPACSTCRCGQLGVLQVPIPVDVNGDLLPDVTVRPST